MSDDIKQEPPEILGGRIKRSRNWGELPAALAKAQGQMEVAERNAENPFFGKRYADLATIWDTIRAPFSANGLSIIQPTWTARDGVYVETRLCHASGEWIASTIWTPFAKYDPQFIGAAQTYLRRYGILGFAGVSSEDDDGQAAAESTKKVATSTMEHLQQIAETQGAEAMRLAWTKLPESARNSITKANLAYLKNIAKKADEAAKKATTQTDPADVPH